MPLRHSLHLKKTEANRKASGNPQDLLLLCGRTRKRKDARFGLSLISVQPSISFSFSPFLYKNCLLWYRLFEFYILGLLSESIFCMCQLSLIRYHLFLNLVFAAIVPDFSNFKKFVTISINLVSINVREIRDQSFTARVLCELRNLDANVSAVQGSYFAGQIVRCRRRILLFFQHLETITSLC